jgi:hypothetical protein
MKNALFSRLLTMAWALMLAGCATPGQRPTRAVAQDPVAQDPAPASAHEAGPAVAHDQDLADEEELNVTCGSERTRLKMMKDETLANPAFRKAVEAQARDLIEGGAVTSSVSELIARPTVKKSRLLGEFGEVRMESERDVVRIRADIVGYKKEGGKKGDHDYHIVIAEPLQGAPVHEGILDSGRTMIIESVDRDCTGPRHMPKPFAAWAENARRQIDARVKAKKIPTVTSEFKLMKRGIPVTVTGMVFFDPLHNQTGVAPNGVELHPIFDIRFE